METAESRSEETFKITDLITYEYDSEACSPGARVCTCTVTYNAGCLKYLMYFHVFINMQLLFHTKDHR